MLIIHMIRIRCWGFVSKFFLTASINCESGPKNLFVVGDFINICQSDSIIEKNWQELTRINKNRREWTRMDKNWQELKRIDKNWQELTRIDKIDKNWQELTRIDKNWQNWLAVFGWMFFSLVNLLWSWR